MRRVSPFHEGADRNGDLKAVGFAERLSPFHEGADRNAYATVNVPADLVVALSRGRGSKH